MPKSLIVVESPAKARTIKKYLGENFEVMASVGHIKDLPKSQLGVDIENNFAPLYETIKGKGKVIRDIKAAAKSAEKVFLAPDPDREGEAIACHIAEEIKDKDKIYRVLFNEITKKGIVEAIKHPLKLDLNRYASQQTRRILDRLVGYKISPILWDKVRRGLSAGRVQSVAVRVICEREAEIRAFISTEYWSVSANFEGKTPPPFEAKLFKFNDKKIDLKNEEETSSLLATLKNAQYLVDKVVKKERKRNPSPPFITSTLQQDAARKLSFSAKKTMMLAQRLYEGIDFGSEGPVGLITYMRTDSVRVADEAITNVRSFITEKFGKQYLPDSPRQFKKGKAIQDAHEAIRPTSMTYTPDMAKKFMEKDQFRLYELIWKRFVASQMNPAIIDQTSIDIVAGNALFRATGSIVRFQGFMLIYTEGKDKVDEEDKEGNLPNLNKGETVKLLKIGPHQHFTEPPPRFTEATLVKELEDKGIGRPSTYAAIISNIQDREYVELNKKAFSPTELGMLITELLVQSFPDIINVEFTAKMEQKLDEIEEGKEEVVQALTEFYEPFQSALISAKETMRNVKKEEVPTDIPCELCKTNMVIKWGKMGEFLACPNYPECKNTTNFSRDSSGKITIEKEEVKLTSKICTKCGKQMAVKIGKFGRFLACSDYPACKSTAPFSMDIKCPDCNGGEICERQSKKGKIFYSCSGYPKCKFASWDKPLPEKCPLCEAHFLVEKVSKKEGNSVRCLEKDCGYKRVQ